MSKRKYILVLIILLITTITIAQTTDSKNFNSWNRIGVKYRPFNKLKLGLEQHLRLKENTAVIDEYFTEFNIEYELIKNLEIGGGLRFIKENDNVGKIQGYENHFRFNVDVSYKFDINRFRLSYRLRYQNKKELNLPDTADNTPTENIRFKTGIEYDFKKWPLDPEFSAEIFSRKREGYMLVSDALLTKYRLTFGTSYNLKKYGKIGLYYRIEQRTIVEDAPQINILGFNYTYTIKKK